MPYGIEIGGKMKANAENRETPADDYEKDDEIPVPPGEEPPAPIRDPPDEYKSPIDEGPKGPKKIV